MQAKTPYVARLQCYSHRKRQRLCARLSQLIKANLFFILAIFSAPMPSTLANANYEALLSSVSSPLPEYGLVISPDGNTAVFSRMSGAWGNRDNQSTLYVTHKHSGEWTPPKHLFGNSFKAGDPFFSLDGTSLFFTTNQTLNGDQKSDKDIWLAEHKTGKFTNPRPLTVVNSSTMESSPVLTANGSLYFSSMRPGGIGAGDIWVSRSIDGAFQTPENLGAPVNTVHGEWNVFVEKDERYILIEASGRPDAKSASGDLYLYEKKGDNWDPAIPLSHINTTGSDLMPRLSSDEKTFFYTSSGAWKSKDTEILQIKASDFLSPPAKNLKRSLMVVSRSNHEAVALDPDTLEVMALRKAVDAYTESRNLNHKADTFLHARTAYRLARKQYVNSPAELAIHTHRYAVAAATYREPIALTLFEETLDLLVRAYGRDNAELSLALVDAADEALTRDEPEKAYAWYDKARDILMAKVQNADLQRARIYMGLARLYMNSGELDKAKDQAEKSFSILNNKAHNAPNRIKANIYFRYGDVQKALNNNSVALDAYNQSLQLFKKKDPRERTILTLHIRLVEINHKLGDSEQATVHCISAQKYENDRNMGIGWPIYDPTGKTTSQKKTKTGQILAGYTRGADCRVRDIVIHKVTGISETEAIRILEQVYIPPRLSDGTLHPNQRVGQTNINVY